ncbi:LAETG motif-containing sortase-dependent surface protein [Streptomyces iconiensis]|uniref:LAETG motif-containing sortase-dependent surface protein n=1 Tax=Streptomyces iconiensis TaxID=1384038 RepID=A0ABT7A0G2_9ACTN|nr:LAETG motif-containing sortase-dependent surface protein [Streptomyces iconiensis]MDJ1134827.1 LAETG motif-containing sortase-dependent surface protein [Streptomyces iconiensis]
MTALRLRWQRSVAITATAAAAFLGTAIAATPAQAHSHGWSVDCYTVDLNLTNYSQDKDNTVKITVGDRTVLSETFKGEYNKKLDLPKHTEELKVTADVVAGDDSKFSWNESKTAPVCETESPSPSPTESETTTPAPSASPTTTPSQSEAPQPSASESSSSAPAAKPQGGGENLAETGSSSNTPMLVGIAAAVVIAGGGLVAFARKRRSSQG